MRRERGRAGAVVLECAGVKVEGWDVGDLLVEKQVPFGNDKQLPGV